MTPYSKYLKITWQEIDSLELGRPGIIWEDLINNYVDNLGEKSVGRHERLTGIDNRLDGKKMNKKFSFVTSKNYSDISD